MKYLDSRFPTSWAEFKKYKSIFLPQHYLVTHIYRKIEPFFNTREGILSEEIIENIDEKLINFKLQQGFIEMSNPEHFALDIRGNNCVYRCSPSESISSYTKEEEIFIRKIINKIIPPIIKTRNIDLGGEKIHYEDGWKSLWTENFSLVPELFQIRDRADNIIDETRKELEISMEKYKRKVKNNLLNRYS